VISLIPSGFASIFFVFYRAPSTKCFTDIVGMPCSLTLNAGKTKRQFVLGMQDGRRIIARNAPKFDCKWLKTIGVVDSNGCESQARKLMICAGKGRLARLSQHGIEGIAGKRSAIFSSVFRLGLLAMGARLRTRWRLRSTIQWGRDIRDSSSNR